MFLKVLDRTKIKHFETNRQLARRVDLKIELKSSSGWCQLSWNTSEALSGALVSFVQKDKWDRLQVSVSGCAQMSHVFLTATVTRKEHQTGPKVYHNPSNSLFSALMSQEKREMQNATCSRYPHANLRRAGARISKHENCSETLKTWMAKSHHEQELLQGSCWS